MSDGVLSQEEINALLGVTSEDEEEKTSAVDMLSEEEKDAIGEIGNISMGTSATTLFTLLNQKVSITTPRVKVWEWEDFLSSYPDDIVIINVNYTEGVTGTNLLLLKQEDVKKITDIMMGGDGAGEFEDEELTDLHLSAIAEAMNQMVGSASTSMSQMLDMKIDISPPQAFMSKLAAEDEEPDKSFAQDGIVQVAFRMKVGTIIDSEIMQILPIDFAKEMVKQLMSPETKSVEEQVQPVTPDTPSKKASGPEIPQQVAPAQSVTPTVVAPSPAESIPVSDSEAILSQGEQSQNIVRDVDVKMPQFPSFDVSHVAQQKENMDIVMDVPLEVTVELGRTSKKIKEILEFNPGTVIELDRLAGEPIDILVNGKYVAEGEVVVIDENFGIRITEIVNPELRI